MTDLEQFQAAEKFDSWIRHPYTSLVFDYLDTKLFKCHLEAENSPNPNIKIAAIEEARVTREIINTLKLVLPKGLVSVKLTINKEQDNQ